MTSLIESTTLQHQVHMEMLAKSENAKDVGDYTVIKLGFAVSIAYELIHQHTQEAVREANLTILNELNHELFFSTTQPKGQFIKDVLTRKLNENAKLIILEGNKDE